jgi:UDP-4-amino-4-deoxy-L-arabinose formyltransferase/UDP-glucuronic acid dehydrogenase (UDP-4-keto-hexauronic acid decarboxylating)
MKIGLIGRSELMFATAELILNAGYKVSFIITSQEVPEYTVKSADFKILADKIGAGFLHTARLGDDESISFLNDQEKCDIVLSVNYSGVIPQKIIDLFEIGILNAHAGDLPKYRGNACPAWSIINTEDKIGLCIHQMIGGELDSGKIIARDFLPLNINTKIGDCYSWMNERIPSLFLESIVLLSQNSNYCLDVQSLNPKDALRCYPRRPEDGMINWRDTSENVIRLINASGSPFCGAFTYYKDEKIIIHDSNLYFDTELYLAIPGQVSSFDKDKGSVIVICGKGKIEINEIEVNNVIMPASDYIIGIRNRLVS